MPRKGYRAVFEGSVEAMSNDTIEKIAKAMMHVVARWPGHGSNGDELPVLSLDTDWDDLPRDGSEGTLEDEITKEAVLKLARAAIEAMREPAHEDLDARRNWAVCEFNLTDWQAMIDAMLTIK